MTLEDLKWENRIVLYFPGLSEVGDFHLTDSIQEEIEDRKLAYFVFQESIISNKQPKFSANYIHQLHSKYRLGSKSESWVLIGLDGGVKMKSEKPLDWDLIFKTIDGMPMRQSEMRRDL